MFVIRMSKFHARIFGYDSDETFELTPLTSDDMTDLIGTRSNELDFFNLNYLGLEDVNVDDLYVVKRVKLPNFPTDHELEIPDDDEG